MSTSSNSSGSSSAKTSASAQQKPTETDQQYLQRQADEARDAILRITALLKRDALRTADPRLWLKQYPWSTLAAATVGGFAAAATAVPSRQQQALRRLAQIEAALHPEHSAKGQRKPQRDRTLLGRVMRRVVRTLRPIMYSTITGAITGAMARAPADDMSASVDTANQI